jgi:HEAT repeat protein
MPRRLKTIEAELSSDDAEVVSKAIDELATLPGSEAMELLYRKSNDDSFPAAKPAADAFVKAVAAHSNVALRHSNIALRKVAIKEVGRAKVVDAIPELARILRSKISPTMQRLSAEALGSIGHTSCVSVLVEARQDSTPELRAAALHGLQSVMQVAGEKAVVGFLEDYDWLLRLDAKEHLESTGWIPQTHREKVLWGIALGRFDEAVGYGQVSVDALIEATLHVNDAEVRRWSAVALSRLSSDHVRKRLAKALRSKSADERAAAAQALAILGDGIDMEGVSEGGESEVSSSSITRESIFAAAARMLTLIGQP